MVVRIWLYDLSDPKDLLEMEKIKSNPNRYVNVTSTTVCLPYCHMEYEDIKSKRITIKLYDVSDPMDIFEMERIKTEKSKYNVLFSETVNLPYCHMEYNDIKQEK
jgi:recombinational DNA repair protein RecR